MNHSVRTTVMAVAAIMLLGSVCMAQEPPLTWKGKGVASFMGEYGVEDLEFEIKLHIDEAGMIKGETKTDDGGAQIERLYYSQKKEYEFGEFSAQEVVFVLLTDSDSDSPMMIILDGRVLVDKFCYGELLLKQYEKDGSVEKGLDIGDKMAAEIYEGYPPEGLKAARKKCVPFGYFKITGGFVTE